MKIVDQIYQCNCLGLNNTIWNLQCYLQIFQKSSGKQVVMVSDGNCEIGWFIPYKLEQLANHIIEDFNLEPERLIWIEHDLAYTRRKVGIEYSQVLFQWEAGKATNPSWYMLDNKWVTDLIGAGNLQLTTV